MRRDLQSPLWCPNALPSLGPRRFPSLGARTVRSCVHIALPLPSQGPLATWLQIDAESQSPRDLIAQIKRLAASHHPFLRWQLGDETRQSNHKPTPLCLLVRERATRNTLA